MLGIILYEPEDSVPQGKEPGGSEGTRSRDPSVHDLQRSLVNIL